MSAKNFCGRKNTYYIKLKQISAYADICVKNITKRITFIVNIINAAYGFEVICVKILK